MSSSFVDGPVQASLAVGTCEEQVGRMNSAGSRESVEEFNHWSRGGLRGVPASWFLPWHERRYAARASGDLLALYRTAKADHPDWVARELPQTGGLDPSRARFDGGRRDPEMCQGEHRGMAREARVDHVRCGAGPVGDGVSRDPRWRFRDPLQHRSGGHVAHSSRPLHFARKPECPESHRVSKRTSLAAYMLENALEQCK